ncbi:MAG TPA: class I SAM-dependent methyltransferase [Chthoniobacterales bacterium]|nr:class I SAM-dependent methyltransferase [Chthoniobacterales bacterium]
MLPNVVATDSRPAASTTRRPQSESADSLFERVAWLYAFCRERLFRDDTERIISTLWPDRRPPSGARVVELGCGPGVYSRKLAQRFPEIDVVGADQSERQLRWARERAASSALPNCFFERVNILALPFEDASFDSLIASRIFTILPDRRRAVGEMFRVLKTGGRCFIAEPRNAIWASIPLFSMWVLASVIHSGNGYREPKKATVFNIRAFEELFSCVPWKSIRVWRDGHYQYALCEKN